MLDELAEVEEAAGEEGPIADIAVEVAVAGVTGVESPTGIEGRTTGAEG